MTRTATGTRQRFSSIADDIVEATGDLGRDVAHLLTAGDDGDGVPEIAILRLSREPRGKRGRQPPHTFDIAEPRYDGNTREDRIRHVVIIDLRSGGVRSFAPGAARLDTPSPPEGARTRKPAARRR